MFEARGHSEIFRELRFAASVERVRNHALIDVRRDTRHRVRREEHIRRRLAAPGCMVWLKEHYPDAEQKDYWKVPYSDVKKQFEESQRQ